MKTKLSIVTLIIIIVLLSTYIIYTKPGAKEIYALNSNKCFLQAMTRYENDLIEKKENTTLLTPKYSYSETKQRGSKITECIYIGGSIMTDGIKEEYIYDVYSGKRLAWYSFFPSKNLTLGSKEEFKTLESKYSTKY